MADNNPFIPAADAQAEEINEPASVNSMLNDTTTRRVIRTALQIFVGLMLAGAFDLIVKRITDWSPDDLDPVISGLWVIAVVAAQNWAENNGVIKPILGTKANVKADA